MSSAPSSSTMLGFISPQNSVYQRETIALFVSFVEASTIADSPQYTTSDNYLYSSLEIVKGMNENMRYFESNGR